MATFGSEVHRLCLDDSNFELCIIGRWKKFVLIFKTHSKTLLETFDTLLENGEDP